MLLFVAGFVEAINLKTHLRIRRAGAPSPDAILPLLILKRTCQGKGGTNANRPSTSNIIINADVWKSFPHFTNTLKLNRRLCPCRPSRGSLLLPPHLLCRWVVWYAERSQGKLGGVCEGVLPATPEWSLFDLVGFIYSSWGRRLWLVDKCHMKGIVRPGCILTFIPAPKTDQLVKLNSKLLITLLCVPVPSLEENSSLERRRAAEGGENVEWLRGALNQADAVWTFEEKREGEL